ncbi:hypothetical protein MPSEU_000960600 [Mayamaea pseudoterrestris]|nr:hypothetical protein MPSEU_000960600 [Mayamaea pseudoterrestris]
MPLPDNIYSINPGSNEQDASSTTANSKNQTLVADGMTKANLLQQFRSTMDLFLQQEGRHEKGLVALLQLFTSTGFYELLPFNQTMMLRLATNSLGVTPAQPNDFHCRFYGDTKLEAAYYLDQVFESHDPVFFACRGLSTLLVNQMAIPPIRVSNLHVSLMLFMKVPKHRSICLENMYLEMCNNYDTDYVKEMHTLEYHFPDTLEEFGTGLDRYAILFDIFANVAKNDRVTSLVGSRLRAFKKAIMEQESMIAAGLSQDVDYLANLCNAVDAVINAHMEDCRKITQRDISMLDQLQVIVDGLYSNSHKSYLHSQCMMDHLPSRRMQAANDKKRAHEQMSIDVASHSSNKRQKTVVRRKKVYSKRVSDDLKLPAPFREIFSPKCYVHCPTVLRNGDKIPLCLNYFIKGKCANLKCNKSHDQPSRPALGRLKAFVKAQVDAYTRKSNRPAPIRSASVQIRRSQHSRCRSMRVGSPRDSRADAADVAAAGDLAGRAGRFTNAVANVSHELYYDMEAVLLAQLSPRAESMQTYLMQLHGSICTNYESILFKKSDSPCLTT